MKIPQVGVLPKVADIKKGYHILQNFLEDSESNFSEAIRSSRTIIEAKFEKNKKIYGNVAILVFLVVIGA